jgi:formylmethanofuran dehydrogenase subunit B
VRISTALDPAAKVSLRVRVPGLSGGGTWFRDDDVPLPLRPFMADSTPEAADALEQLRRRLPPRSGMK